MASPNHSRDVEAVSYSRHARARGRRQRKVIHEGRVTPAERPKRRIRHKAKAQP